MQIVDSTKDQRAIYNNINLIVVLDKPSELLSNVVNQRTFTFLLQPMIPQTEIQQDFGQVTLCIN